MKNILSSLGINQAGNQDTVINDLKQENEESTIHRALSTLDNFMTNAMVYGPIIAEQAYNMFGTLVMDSLAAAPNAIRTAIATPSITINSVINSLGKATSPASAIPTKNAGMGSASETKPGFRS